MVKFFRIVVRLINLFSHDAFKKQPLKVFFRIFTLTYYLFSKKKKLFKTRARNGDFNFLFKPYRGSGYGGRGQYLYRENYDRFFNVNLGGFQRKFNTFLDIGASRGFFSTYMSKVHNSKIIAVDLFEYAIKDCEENLNLNNDYEGAELYINDEQILLDTGSIVFFPSTFLYPHKVKPTTKGVRYSFVSWAY